MLEILLFRSLSCSCVRRHFCSSVRSFHRFFRSYREFAAFFAAEFVSGSAKGAEENDTEADDTSIPGQPERFYGMRCMYRTFPTASNKESTINK